MHTVKATLTSHDRDLGGDLLIVLNFLFVLEIKIRNKNGFLFSSENSAGKYISPFHDIPIYANEAEVSIVCPS